MKRKLSITIEEEKIELINRLLRDGRFRSKSHIVEYGISRFLEEEAKR